MKTRSVLKRILTLVMTLVLLLEGSVSAFAGSSEDPTVEGSFFETENINNNTSQKAGGKLSVSDSHSYILAVYTGEEAGKCCYKIAVTYKSGSQQNGKNNEITQILDVKDGKVTNNVTAESSVNDHYFRNGSRYNTYITRWNDNTSSEKDGRYYYIGDKSYHYADSLYSKWITDISGSDNAARIAKYFTENQINNTYDSMFPSYSTEYICFKPEYDLNEVVKVEFLLSGKSVDQWSLLGWDMYMVQDWATFIGSMSNYDGPAYLYSARTTFGSRNSIFNGYTSPAMTSYSYFSDRLALVLKSSKGSGVQHIAQGEYDKERRVGLDKTQGIVTFISKNANAYKSYLNNPNNPQSGFILNTYTLTKDESSATYNASPKTLNFEIKFSDEQGSGIGTYFTAIKDSAITLTDGNPVSSQYVFNDFLFARINYTNTQGFEEEVEVPVVSNVIMEAVLCADEYDTSVASSAALEAVLTNNIASFAQEGQSLTFHMDFPDFKKLNSIRIKYNNDVDSKDTIQIHSITAYDDSCEGSRAGYYETDANGLLSTRVPEGSTVLYRNNEYDYDLTIDNATAYIYEMVPPEESRYTPGNYTNTYLVTLNTSNVLVAGTTDKVYVQFDYLSSLGGEKSTDEYDISEACQSFYGYNPGIVSPSKDNSGKDVYPTGNDIFTQALVRRDGTTEEYVCRDGSYYYGMAPGGTISFYVRANDLTRFTAAKFRIEAENDTDPVDEWQLDSIRIQSIESVSDRVINPIYGGEKIGDTTIYNFFTREVPGDILVSKDNVYLLIQNEEVQTYRFEDDSYSGNLEKGRDYSEYYYSMSYEIATSNLNFTGISKTYEVRVNVAGKRDALTDDSAGSANLFYFQLVFKNGKSAYVLANQQLEADGFRSGQQETFFIRTNEDYGDVVAVNIIPDDVTEDSSRLDKLCIDSIEVIKQNENGINKKYLISNVGWISPEYHDETNDQYRSSGRAVRDMVSSFSVSSTSYMLSLEFAISYEKYGTMAYTEVDNNGDTITTTKETPQFEGTLYADLTYVNNNGEVKRDRGINIIEKMNSYDGLSPVTDGSDDNITISNANWMFRENTIDRFTLNVEDIQSLKSISLKGTALYGTKLSISGMSVSIITSSGRRYITANNEYRYLYAEDPILLVDSVINRNFPEIFYFASNLETSYTFTFNEEQATIPSFDEETSLSSVISRVPDSVNDTMNVFIYMKEGAQSPRQSGQTLTSEIYYSSTSTGKTYLSKLTDYDESEVGGKIMLSATGLTATNMTTLTNFLISAKSSYTKAWIDHAVIQQVRNDTIVKTYNVKFIGYDASSRVGVAMTIGNNVTDTKETQTVTVQLTDDTATKHLTSEKYDVGASIYYTSTIGDTTKVYCSPYVFLTDSGTYRVQAGQLCSFTFSESNVNKIVGVKFAATNGLEVGTDRVSIITSVTNETTGTTEETGIYSSDGEVLINAEGFKYDMVSATNSASRIYKTADFSFKTMSNSEIIDSKGAYPIRMTINYKDVNGLDKSEIIEDITAVADEDSSFAAGGTVKFSRMLKGVDVLDSIKIEPYNDDSSVLAMWNLESVSFAVARTSMATESTVGVGKTIFEGTPKTIGTVSSVMKLTVSDGTSVKTYFNEDVNVSFDGYGSVTIAPEVVGGGEFSKYSYVVYADLTGEGFAKTGSGNGKSTGDKINVAITENLSTVIVQKYKVVVSSDYLPDLKYNVNIDVYGSVASEQLTVEEEDRVQLGADYSVAGITGSAVNQKKTVRLNSSKGYEIEFNTKSKNLLLQSATCNMYVNETGAGFVLKETKNILVGQTMKFSYEANTSITNERRVLYEFISTMDTSINFSVEVVQPVNASAVVMNYSYRGLSGEIKNGEKKITSYGTAPFIITVSAINTDSENYTFTAYHVSNVNNQPDRIIASGTYSGILSTTVAIAASERAPGTGTDTYKIVARSTDNPSQVYAELTFIQDPLDESLHYNVGNQKGSITSVGTRQVDAYGSPYIELEANLKNNDEPLQYYVYVDEGDGVYKLIENKKLSDHTTKFYFQLDLNKTDNVKNYKYVIYPVERPEDHRTLIVHLQPDKPSELKISYDDGKDNKFTLVNESKEISYSGGATRTISLSYTGYKTNSQYVYTYYYDAGDGQGYREIYSGVRSAAYSMTVQKSKNDYGQDEKYKIVLTSVEDPEISTTLITTFKGSGGTSYNKEIIMINMKSEDMTENSWIANEGYVVTQYYTGFQFNFRFISEYENKQFQVSYKNNNNQATSATLTEKGMVQVNYYKYKGQTFNVNVKSVYTTKDISLSTLNVKL